MKYALVLLFLTINIQVSASIYTGVVLSSEDNSPMSYVSIGIVGKDIGTLTDIYGKFSISIGDSMENDKIAISFIGYKKLEIRVKNFKELCNKRNNFYLVKKPYELKEFSIMPQKNKHMRYGVTANNKLFIAGYHSTSLGYESGVIIPIEHANSYIDSIQINICLCYLDTLFFKVNIYEISDSGIENILNEPIFVYTPHKEIKNHSVVVDLSRKHIQVNHDFLISVENLKDIGERKIYFCASLGNRTGVVRKTSEGIWRRVPLATPAISAYLKYPVNK